MPPDLIPTLAQYITSQILKQPKRTLGAVEPLLSSGLIDSFSLVDIALYVEETFVVPLQKVYFDITDVNEGDFTAGNLVVWNETKGGVVTDNVSLGTNVEHFTWIARSSYEVSFKY